MSTAKHTPGPWLHKKGGQVTSANGWVLAAAHHTARFPDANDEREEGESWCDAYARLKPVRDGIETEMEANARLIASAPELLEALQDTLQILEAYCGDFEETTRNSARAAIAKATGGAI